MAKTKTLKNHKKQTKQKGGNRQDIEYKQLDVHNKKFDTISNVEPGNLLNFRIKFYINTTSPTTLHSRIAFCKESTEDQANDACYNDNKRWFETENYAGFDTNDFNNANISCTVLCSMKVVESHKLNFELTEIKSIEFNLNGYKKLIISDKDFLNKIQVILKNIDKSKSDSYYLSNLSTNDKKNKVAIPFLIMNISNIIDVHNRNNPETNENKNIRTEELLRKFNKIKLRQLLNDINLKLTKELNIKLNDSEENNSVNSITKIHEIQIILKELVDLNNPHEVMSDDSYNAIITKLKILNKLNSDTSKLQNIEKLNRLRELMRPLIGYNSYMLDIGSGDVTESSGKSTDSELIKNEIKNEPESTENENTQSLQKEFDSNTSDLQNNKKSNRPRKRMVPYDTLNTLNTIKSRESNQVSVEGKGIEKSDTDQEKERQTRPGLVENQFFKEEQVKNKKWVHI